MNIAERFQRVARRLPAKVAVVAEDGTLNYEQLDDATTALAGWFCEQGLRPGDRVAVHALNSSFSTQLFLACFKAGVVVVTLRTALKAPEVSHVLLRSGARMYFGQPQLAATAAETCRTAQIPIFTALPTYAAPPPHPPPIAIEPDHPAVVLHTSGATARPKGTLHSHETLIAAARLVTSIDLTENDTVLVLTATMHGAGLKGQLLPALLSGATAVLASSQEAGLVLDLIDRHRCTWTMSMPAMARSLVDEQARRPRGVGSLKTVIVCGDRVGRALHEEFRAVFGFSLQEGYAMTECGLLTVNPKRSIVAGSVGLPLEGVELRIVDPSGDDMKEGDVGELLARSPAGFRGYWGEEDPVSHWHPTGDLFRRDGDGYYHFHARLKHIIIRAGTNISPTEVEEVLLSHPAVREAAVTGRPHAKLGEEVVAAVSLKPQTSVGEQALREFTAERLADYKVPSRIIFLDNLPKESGKVDRVALRTFFD